jgi:hypothetical protein
MPCCSDADIADVAAPAPPPHALRCRHATPLRDCCCLRYSTLRWLIIADARRRRYAAVFRAPPRCCRRCLYAAARCLRCFCAFAAYAFSPAARQERWHAAILIFDITPPCFRHFDTPFSWFSLHYAIIFIAADTITFRYAAAIFFSFIFDYAIAIELPLLFRYADNR